MGETRNKEISLATLVVQLRDLKDLEELVTLGVKMKMSVRGGQWGFAQRRSGGMG